MSRFQDEAKIAEFWAPKVFEYLGRKFPELDSWQLLSNSMNIYHRLQAKNITGEYAREHYCLCLRAYYPAKDLDFVTWFDVPISRAVEEDWWVEAYPWFEEILRKIQNSSEKDKSVFIFSGG